MLWLCISLPQWPLEALQAENTDIPTAVTACEGNTRWIICCNPAAERVHLKEAMSYTTALAIHPRFQSLERNPKSERLALERLAAWAYQFSSTVIVGDTAASMLRSRTSCLWLEIGASLKLFGGFRKLIERLEMQLQSLHYSYRLGIGPTLEAAALLANAEIRIAITTVQALLARIRNLPIAKLALDPEVSEQLHKSGVRSIGVLLELPRDSLARRFGTQFCNFLDRLIGAAPDPRPAFKLPIHYSGCCEFDFEIRSTEALLFPLRRMLHEFAGFLRARDTAVQRFTVTLAHHDTRNTELCVGSSIPQRDAERLFSLVREQLESICVPAPSLAITVACRQFTAPTTLQTDLLHRASQHAEMAHTLDRIRARLGNEQVYGLKQLAAHRPEMSWAATQCAEGSTQHDFPDRPLWLLADPLPLKSAALPIHSGPERIESGWWDGGDARRDYFVVRTSNGAHLWVYRDLGGNDQWYLHGFWA